MKILGIDFGTKKIGIAVSNEDETLAFPVDVIQSKSAIDYIIKKSQEENIKTIILGHSKDFHMKDNPVMEEANKFIIKLKELGFEVILHDEFMSSMEASRIQGYNKKQDASAAAIVLQSYLDTKHD
ncbi:MAG: Holliday junction resolvase RuvX [Candidatus Pacebacteria bacterium]|nr:Holliday junction resolvase RuvX [Candidatus Paceibacterota bacterium]